LRLESIAVVQVSKERPVRKKSRKKVAVRYEICWSFLARTVERERENGREALKKVKKVECLADWPSALRRLAARDSSPLQECE
jgi:hypothetical protein